MVKAKDYAASGRSVQSRFHDSKTGFDKCLSLY